MFRSLVLLAAIALVVGCVKGDAKPSGETGASNSGDPKLAELPKLQPKAKFKLPGEPAPKGAVQLSPDGRTLFFAQRGPRAKIHVWDISGEPKAVAELAGSQFALSSSGKFLFAAEGFQTAVYDVATKKVVAKPGHSGSHFYFRDDHTLVFTTRSYDFERAAKGKITVWDIAKNADAGSFEIPDNRFGDALPASGGKEFWLFMGHDKFEVECYDIATKKLVRTIKPENDSDRPFTDAGIWPSISADASVFASNVLDLRFYDAATGKIVCAPPDTVLPSPTGFIPVGNRYLARGGARGSGLKPTDYLIYDWKAKKGLAVLTGHSAGEKDAMAGVSGDGKTLVSVTKSGEGLVFDISPAK